MRCLAVFLGVLAFPHEQLHVEVFAGLLHALIMHAALLRGVHAVRQDQSDLYCPRRLRRRKGEDAEYSYRQQEEEECNQPAAPVGNRPEIFHHDDASRSALGPFGACPERTSSINLSFGTGFEK